MGKQIRFFMAKEDELEFYDLVLSSNDFFIDDKQNILDKEALFNSNEITLYIAQPNSNIIKDENGYINIIRSEVIEYSRCLFRNSNLDYGRLWAEFKFYDSEGELVQKEKWFNDKFSSYRKWIKKNYRVSKSKDFYIGEQAYKLYLTKELEMMATPLIKVEF